MKRIRQQRRTKPKAKSAAALTEAAPVPTTGFATKMEAAKFLRLSRSTITRMVKDGTLRSKKIVRCRRIPWSVLHEMAGSQVAATT